MNLFEKIKENTISLIAKHFSLEKPGNISISLNADRDASFGDLSCNAAMVLAKTLNKNPKAIAEEIISIIKSEHIEKVEIAGPGFINITLTKDTWHNIANELYSDKKFYLLPENVKRKKYLLEYVSANPTGPLHLGHGRNGIIGDVLGNILKFLGHSVQREFYVNDAGKQMQNLGLSLKTRCSQLLGGKEVIPEGGYQGQYLIDTAEVLIATHGKDVLKQPDEFFIEEAKKILLERIKNSLSEYNIEFDSWFSEKTLHEDGSIKTAIQLLKDKDLAYEQDGALWFRSTKFGDDKDRVIRKQDGTLTYIAADIAYHKNKFDRGFDILIDILGQDHHGYVKRLKATMEALGYNSEALKVILYQLVSIKSGSTVVKMSKRAGTFTTLEEIIETVGRDVARFYYLNRKADMHLDFDLSSALKKTEENPAYYVQYAYVRTNSVLKKAASENLTAKIENLVNLTNSDVVVIKKIVSLKNLLIAIGESYQTHLLAYYTIELAKTFHGYYTHNRIIDQQNPAVTKSRLMLTEITRNALGTCLDLLGLSKPKKM